MPDVNFVRVVQLLGESRKLLAQKLFLLYGIPSYIQFCDVLYRDELK